MNRKRRTSMLSGSPVLVGAVTVIVTIVAVFLSYNANEGLPFVPTYSITADVPTANGLVRGNEVRMGGARIGVVTDITTDTKDNGQVSAHLKLDLDERVTPLPNDSTLAIRPRSALGLKYVEIVGGKSSEGFEEGGTIPLSASKVKPVEIDEFFNMWDDPTRVGSRVNLDSFGAGFAGRGRDLNTTFATLGPLMEKLEPVMRNIASPRTAWNRFFPSLYQAASQTVPAADANAANFAALNTTFAAWESVSGSLQETISEGPASLDIATRELAAQQPFLNNSEELFRRLRPAFGYLASASPDLATAFRAGTPALRRSPALNRRLTRTLQTFEKFGDDPRVPAALARITRTMQLLQPTLAFVTPAQTVCNYGALFFRNLASASSESDSIGAMLRVGASALPQLPNSEAGPASAPANGPPPPPGLSPIQRSLVDDSFLHSNPYPYTASPGQPRECEAGNETYEPGHMVIGNPPGDQGTFSENTKRSNER